MRNDEISVIKYGSSVLRSKDDLQSVIDDLNRVLVTNRRVVAIVSAFDGVTDRLLGAARKRGLDRTSAAFAKCVGAGEFETAKLLGEALSRSGTYAIVRSPRSLGFIASGNRIDANPVIVDRNQLQNAIDDYSIVVIPGYSAIDDEGNPMLLGRGGSDLSAIQMAYSLGTRLARLVKDVDGVYDRDPNQFPHAKRMSYLNHRAARSICGDLIQDKALSFAEERGVDVLVTSLGREEGTLISSTL